MYCYEAVHQQSRMDGGRREGGGGYRAGARFLLVTFIMEGEFLTLQTPQPWD